MASHETIEHPETPETKTTDEARQGDGRRMNLRVLLISFVLAVVVLAALYAFLFPLPG